MGVLGTLIVNNIVDYTIRSTINAGKFFDVPATKKYFGDWSDSFTDFENYANEHFVAMDAVATTDTWMGVDADAAKTMLSDTETTLLNDILKLHDDIDSLHTTILKNFELTVDSDPEAYISYDDLIKIENDFKEKSEAYNAQVKTVEDMILDLQEKYSKYGDIRTQNFSAGKTAFAMFCGPDESLGSLAVEIAFSNFCSDEPEGYLAKCRQKLIQFDNETQILIEEANLDSRVDDLNKRMASFIVENHPEYLQLTNLNNVDKFVSGDNILLFDASFWSFVDVKLVRKIYSKVIKDNSNYAVNRPFFYGYMTYLNNIGSDNWSDEDCESISMIMHIAIKNNDTELLNHALSEFTYTKEIDRRDTWGGYNVTYEIGVNKELMSKVLEHVDWKTQGRTYSTLSRIANMPSETFKTAYYDNGEVRKGYEKPYISLGSSIVDEKLKITITTNNNSYDFMSVNMYKKIGEEGYQNLKAIGMSDDEICQFANSIFTKEDIQFIQGLSQATTEEEYYKVAQINPDKLSDSGNVAFSIYGLQVFDNCYDYEIDSDGNQIVKENKDGINKLLAFSNGMFLGDNCTLSPEERNDYQVGAQTQIKSEAYCDNYFKMAYLMTNYTLDNSQALFEEYVDLDKEDLEQRNKFFTAQKQNYDYMTYLEGIRAGVRIKNTNLVEQTTGSERRKPVNVYDTQLDSISIYTMTNGRIHIDFNLNKTNLTKKESDSYNYEVLQYCGEDIDNEYRKEDYDKAVKEYNDSIKSLGLDIAGCVPVFGELQNIVDVGNTIIGIGSDGENIVSSHKEVEEKYERLMCEWNQDGIKVEGLPWKEQLKVGDYDPETIYKWNIVQRDGLSVMCADTGSVKNGTDYINSISEDDINEAMSGKEWNRYTVEEKKEILTCIWTGETGKVSIDDLSNDQFDDAVKFLQNNLPVNINYDNTAVGKTFSEKLSNWEAY